MFSENVIPMRDVKLNQREQARIQVLNTVLEHHLSTGQAAEIKGVSERHTKRLLAAYRKDGPAALAHGNRGLRPHNAVPEAAATAVVKLASNGYAGANHSHFTELLRERESIDLSRPTVRRILVRAGLGSPRRRRSQHQSRLRRMPQEGMLIQLDGSYHRWLGEDGPQFTILFAVDDATGCVLGALFCDHEDTGSYFLLMQGLIRRHGIPLVLYTDRHAVFIHRSENQPTGTPTQFSRAMEELGIQMIFALSPQGKGRVERAAGTFQDRLVTELRLAGASSIGEANRVLEHFLPRFNRRFGVPPLYPEPAFRPLDSELCLDQVLCFKHRRKVARDNTVRFQLHTLQLLPGPERPSYAGAAVEVLESLDGRLSLRHEGRIVPAQEAPPSPVFLRNGHGPTDAAPVPSSGANGLGESWTAALEPLRSRAEDEEGSRGHHRQRGHSRQAQSRLPAQANVPPEGAMEGNSESPAQGDVA